MACRKCGESARFNGSFGSVVELEYDDKGNASYYCLNCVIEALKNGNDTLERNP